MRPRADGQRQGQIKEPEAASAAFVVDVPESFGYPAIRAGSGRGMQRCGKADIGDRERPGSILTRADGGVRAQESSVKSPLA